MSDFQWLSAVELARMYRTGECSPLDVAESLLADINEINPVINAYCVIDPNATVADAQSSTERYRVAQPLSRLDGVPIAVKDFFASTRWPNRRGSQLTPDTVDQEESPASLSLTDAGAVFLGRTTTPEFGWKGVTDSPLTGITRNPWNPDLTCGGSSGGNGAAIAAGIATMAVGTDGGGSIRIPATFCGIVGFKPTHALVPVYPPSPSGDLSHVGPMARSVQDCALLLDVITRPDPRECAAITPPQDSFFDLLQQKIDMSTIKVAYSPNLGFGKNNPEVDASVKNTVELLEELGATVDTVEINLGNPEWAMQILWFSAIIKTATQAAENYRKHHLESDPYSLLDPYLAALVKNDYHFTAMDYLTACDEKARWGTYMGVLLSHYDVLVLPTVPIAPFAVGRMFPDNFPLPQLSKPEPSQAKNEASSWSPYTFPFNLTGQPAISIPCGIAENMPVGFQIVGARNSDAKVLQVAAALEEAIGWQGLAAQTPWTCL